ncbi:MAG: FG-GAP-like repeat-containing protein, partial [Chloroflexi bacterium]|nr:FG-GAP-like repeat-containing protein [Chloroflexota bacterium]
GDVIVGAYDYDNGQTGEGRAYVYHGSAGGLATGAAWTAESDQASAFFGVSVATGGDVNGDGYGDVVVGAYGFDNGQSGEGRAYAYLGSASGLATGPTWTAEGDQTNAGFGESVAPAGDVNGDGYGDLIVGAPFLGSFGRAFLYLGSSSGIATSAAWTADGHDFMGDFGSSVATAGDVNGDGYADVIVGEPNADSFLGGSKVTGQAHVHLGSASGLSLSAAWSVEGDTEGALLGSSVGTAGDVNADGYSDVVVGATHFGPGEAYLYLGSSSGLATTPAWTVSANQSSYLGFSVGTAGDVNGDGYSDVLVGAYAHDNGETDEGAAFLYLGSASGPSTTAAWTAEGNQASA